MTYGDKRRRFTYMQALLVVHAKLLGYELAGKYWFRCPECKIGDDDSLHKEALAIDYDLYKDKVWLSDGTGHHELHDYWDLIGGAKRIKKDLNHYSYNPGGSKR